MTETSAPTEPAGAAPAGRVTDTATCCPLVGTFDASAQPGRTTGYDRRTNLAQTEDQDEYWVPPGKAKLVPTDRYAQDGAGWTSVCIGETTEIEVDFEGQSGNGCIVNCDFDLLSDGIVEIATPKVSSPGATLRLKGLAEGETTLRITCNGSEIGWVHVVCYEKIIIESAVCTVSGVGSRPARYNVGAMERALNKSFGPAGIEIILKDAGAIDLSDSGAFSDIESSRNMPSYWDWFVDGFGEVNAGDMVFWPLASELSADGTSLVGSDFNEDVYPLVDPMVKSRVPSSSFTFMFYIPTAVGPLVNGVAYNDFATPFVTIFKDFQGIPGYHAEDAYAIAAHEMGHALGLQHPDLSDASQIPDHLYNSIGQPVVDQPGTNAEIPVSLASLPRPIVPNDARNIMARDPLNLMGYWPAFQQQSYLRKLQWDSCRINAKTLKREPL